MAVSGRLANVLVAFDDPDDPFKDLTAEDDMELDETIEGLRTRLPKEVPLQCNAAALLEIDEEIATSGDKPTDADFWHSSEENLLLIKRMKTKVKSKISHRHALPVLR